MKTAAILSLASLLSSFVQAVPLDKRALVTEVKTEIVYVTTTIWVDPPTETSTAVDGAFYDNPTEEDIEEAEPVVSTTSSYSSSSVSSSSTPPPPPSSTPTPTPSPSPSPSPSSEVAPVSTPAPTYEQQPEPVEQPAQEEVQVEESTYPQGETTSTPSGSYDHQGWMSWFYPDVGSCGIKNNDGDLVVAISRFTMDRFSTGNSNENPLCGKTITIDYQGKTLDVKVADRCFACSENDLDATPAVFEKLTGNKDIGKVDISWSMA